MPAEPTAQDHERAREDALEQAWQAAYLARNDAAQSWIKKAQELLHTALAEQREGDIKAVRWALGPTRADQPEYAEEVVAAIRRGDA